MEKVFYGKKKEKRIFQLVLLIKSLKSCVT